MNIPERLPRELGRDYALRVIRENIETSELEPGSMISESELASRLGLSRTPVREALIELSKANIVEIYPQRGSFVSLIDYTMVEEARFMRNVLEHAVVREVCEIATEEDIMRLKENLHLQQFYLKNNERDKLMEKDNELHQLLFDIADKPNLFALIRFASIHFDRVRHLSLIVVRDLKIVEDHEKLIRAIEERDADRAEEVMEIHLSRYKIDAEAIKAAHPHYIKPED